MTRPGEEDPDAYWRRPRDHPDRPAANPDDGTPTPPAYAGPPSSSPPAPDWHPPIYREVPPPRRLPAQDLARLDAEERRARSVTYGLGIAAAVVLLVALCLLCSRLV
ncbi:MAG TPA: translation initiation factor 2 [Micromonosporaceae bacterium]